MTLTVLIATALAVFNAGRATERWIADRYQQEQEQA